MSEQQPFLLEEAPSIDDIVSAAGRVGAVDFTAPAEPETEVPPTTGLFDAGDDADEAEELALLLTASAARRPPDVRPDVQPDVRPEPDDLRTPARSVAEVAAAVTERMRAVEDAHERHVEAIEIEAARRCELLTAQAELDAELIRLHARREAHAIVAASRLPSGESDQLDESLQLDEIGDTFSRFAESIEGTVTSGPESPDPTRWS